MARRRNNTFEMLWQGLVVLPAFAGFAIGFNALHAVIGACVCAGAGAGLGIGILTIYKLNHNEKLKISGISNIDKMDGRQFEHYLGHHLFKSQGFSVEVTRESGDFGADLVIAKDGRKIVVQAKRHSKNVGIKAVQEVQASIAKYKAHEAWVVSNRGYTDAAKELARSNGVRLINRQQLVEMILQMSPEAVPNPKQVIASLPQQTMSCDRCGKPMVVRNSARGDFWGCSGYPRCRNIKQLAK